MCCFCRETQEDSLQVGIDSSTNFGTNHYTGKSIRETNNCVSFFNPIKSTTISVINACVSSSPNQPEGPSSHLPAFIESWLFPKVCALHAHDHRHFLLPPQLLSAWIRSVVFYTESTFRSNGHLDCVCLAINVLSFSSSLLFHGHSHSRPSLSSFKFYFFSTFRTRDQ